MHLDKVRAGPADASCGQAVPRLEGRVDWLTQHLRSGINKDVQED